METPHLFDDSVALITGGTSGIGKTTAEILAAAGVSVVITGRRANKGHAVVDAIVAKGGKAAFIQADHALLADCERVVKTVIEDFGSVDVLFNNAGIVLSGTAETTTEAEWLETLNLNVTAAWRMSKLVLPQMRKQGKGVIVNNASDWGLVGAHNALAYSVSKGALVQMTRSMALDHAHENIRVNAVCPGDTFVERWLEDGYFENVDDKVDEARLAQDAAHLPMRRVGAAKEIAQAVLFLASDLSSYMTGATLAVDGGNTAQ